MSRIINPSTGQPASMSPEMQIIGELMQGTQMLFQKVQALTAQQMHLGLYVEFFTEHLLKHEVDGETFFKIDMNAFPEWAEARTKEIREEAQAMIALQEKAKASGQYNIDLSDSTDTDESLTEVTDSDE